MLTTEFYSPALVTLLSVFMLQRFTIAVGKARAAYGVHPPKTTGNEKFEQVFRVHQNTLEQYPTFIVVCYLYLYLVLRVCGCVRIRFHHYLRLLLDYFG